MKRILVILVAVVALAQGAQAQSNHSHRQDSLYVYNSWEAMFDGIADTIVMNPDFNVYTRYTVEFSPTEKDLRKWVKDYAVAVAIGDSLWYINSKWIKKNFTGDFGKMSHYVPLYFTAKVAFVQWASTNRLWSLFIGDEAIEPDEEDGQLYVFDFENLTLEKVDAEKLISLLEIYPDLQRRYKMMRDYDKVYMVNDYFLQYVERIGGDPNVTYLF